MAVAFEVGAAVAVAAAWVSLVVAAAAVRAAGVAVAVAAVRAAAARAAAAARVAVVEAAAVVPVVAAAVATGEARRSCRICSQSPVPRRCIWPCRKQRVGQMISRRRRCARARLAPAGGASCGAYNSHAQTWSAHCCWRRAADCSSPWPCVPASRRVLLLHSLRRCLRLAQCPMLASPHYLARCWSSHDHLQHQQHPLACGCRASACS